LGGYAFEQSMHPFMGEPVAVAQGRKTPLEGAMGMLELPVYPSKSSYNYVKGLKTPMGKNQQQKYQDMISAGMDPKRASDVISAERLIAKARREEKEALTATQKESVRNQARFKLTSLKQESETGEPILTGNLELDSLLYAEQQDQLKSDAIAIIKNPYLTETEKRQVIESKDLDYQTTLYSALKGLKIPARSAYILEKIRSTNQINKVKEAMKLADADVLSTGVVDEWFRNGLINVDEKKTWKDLIKQSKGTYSAPKGKKKSFKKPPTLKINLPQSTTMPAPRINAPRLTPRSPLLVATPKMSGLKLSGAYNKPLERAVMPTNLIGATKKIPIQYAGRK